METHHHGGDGFGGAKCGQVAVLSPAHRGRAGSPGDQGLSRLGGEIGTPLKLPVVRRFTSTPTANVVLHHGQTGAALICVNRPTLLATT